MDRPMPQQAYDNYMSQLGDKTMDIYDRVYQQYLNEGQELYNQLGMVNNQDSIDYSRYRDTVNDYYNDLNYYAGRYDSTYAQDFGEYQYNQDAQRWAEEYAYKKTQDALAQQNWQTQFDYQKHQDALDYALKQQQLAASRSGGKKSSGGKKASSAEGKLTETEAEQYLDIIRSSKGIAAANKEYAYLVKNGLIDNNVMSEEMVKAAQNNNMKNLGYNYSDENKLKYALSMMNRK